MIERELLIDVFTSPERIETGTLKWSERYSDLISRLGELGSEVQCTRTLITNQVKSPGHFISAADHIFVFPPQPLAEVKDTSCCIDDRPGHKVYQESKEWSFDESKAEGVLRVYYDDSDNRVEFRILGDLDRVDEEGIILAAVEQALSEAHN